MPMELPALTPEIARTNRVVLFLVLLFDSAVLLSGWVVAHVTSSVGWGFVTIVVALLVGVPIVLLLVRRIQGRARAALVDDSDPRDLEPYVP
jgi:tetrahydromethanopterin S-methyltransferase subunit E